MQNDYSQRIQMQIPQGNTYTGVAAMPDFDEEQKTFLKQNFYFPSNNLNEINKFINKDDELKKIIYKLSTEISSELSYNEISLDFMKETDPSEKILEIVIYSKLNESNLLEKEDIISDKLIDKFPKTTLEYIILVEPYDGA